MTGAYERRCFSRCARATEEQIGEGAVLAEGGGSRREAGMASASLREVGLRDEDELVGSTLSIRTLDGREPRGCASDERDTTKWHDPAITGS